MCALVLQYFLHLKLKFQVILYFTNTYLSVLYTIGAETLSVARDFSYTVPKRLLRYCASPPCGYGDHPWMVPHMPTTVCWTRPSTNVSPWLWSWSHIGALSTRVFSISFWVYISISCQFNISIYAVLNDICILFQCFLVSGDSSLVTMLCGLDRYIATVNKLGRTALFVNSGSHVTSIRTCSYSAWKLQV